MKSMYTNGYSFNAINMLYGAPKLQRTRSQGSQSRLTRQPNCNYDRGLSLRIAPAQQKMPRQEYLRMQALLPSTATLHHLVSLSLCGFARTIVQVVAALLFRFSRLQALILNLRLVACTHLLSQILLCNIALHMLASSSLRGSLPGVTISQQPDPLGYPLEYTLLLLQYLLELQQLWHPPRLYLARIQQGLCSGIGGCRRGKISISGPGLASVLG